MDIEIYYGPPGTGKTTTLMDILDFEINTKGLRPKEIAFVSFTKKGVEQGIQRAKLKFDYPNSEFVYFRTLHSMAFRETYASRKNVMDKKKYSDFSKKMGMHFTGYYTEEFHHNDDMYLFGSELYRNNPKAGKMFIEHLNFDIYTFVQKNYKRYKETFGYIDFTDMVQNFIKENRSVPVKVAIVDEAQDLTTLQWEMVWKAFRNCDRVYIAGDDDQAIYQWSGADVDYFLSLHGNTHILNHSYRLPQNFVKFANKITSQIIKRVDKTYEGREGKGDLDVVNSLNEIQIDPEQTYLVLSRNNCFLKGAEEWIQRQGLPYLYKGERIITEKHLDDIRFYEHKRKTLIIDNEDERRLKGLLKEGANFSKPWYDSFCWDQWLIDYIRTIVARKPSNLFTPHINISTIHSIKGGEADNVILLTDITKNVEENLTMNPDSEHRVFYVGITRAKQSIRIVLPSTKCAYKFY